jgi:hypothetical protein
MRTIRNQTPNLGTRLTNAILDVDLLGLVPRESRVQLNDLLRMPLVQLGPWVAQRKRCSASCSNP